MSPCRYEASHNPGFVRSKCTHYNPAVSIITVLDFGALGRSGIRRQRIRLDLTIMGLEGSAYFDSGALASVESQRLHQRLKADGIPSQNKKMRVKLADGHPKDLQLKTYERPVQLAGRAQQNL